MKRASGQRPHKKKPPANRYVAPPKPPAADFQEAGPSTAEPRSSSASRKKLSETDLEIGPDRKDWNGFRIVDIDLVFGELLECLVCKKCRKSVSIKETSLVGLRSIFDVVCENCGPIKTFRSCISTEESGKGVAEANRRVVYAGRSVGLGHDGVNKFCAMMDLPPPLTIHSHNAVVDKIFDAVFVESEKSMKEAIKKEISAQGSTDLTGSGDGTWQRRGFSSKNGVVTYIGAVEGQVMDVEVLSTACKGCEMYKGPKSGPDYEEWREDHAPHCQINHDGSPGMMEPIGMKRIFRRSLERGGVRYKRYIGDGDSKTFKALTDDQPYGPDFQIEKVECVARVQKRMGTHLRNVRKDCKGKKLADNKPMGGKGRLTDKKIDLLSQLYGNAIRGASNVQDMKNAIWAIYYHYRSTDENPTHHLCPEGPESWCKYNQALSQETTDEARQFSHKSSIPEAIMDVLKKVFEDLSKDELLQRCVGAFTQNVNESLNGLIWKNVPKTVFCSKKIVELGTRDAVLVFNGGQKTRAEVLKHLGIPVGKFFVTFVNFQDKSRIKRSDKRTLEATKEARVAKRQKARQEEARLQAEEGLVYQPGGF